MRLADRRRRPRRARRRPRLPRRRRRRRRRDHHARARAALHAPAALQGVPARRARRRRPADRGPGLVREPRRRACASAARRETLDPDARTLAARQRRVAAATTPACSPPAPSPRSLPVPGATDGVGARCCAASRPPACCATKAAEAKSAIVIGSGFIGCEAAASLALRGVEVTLVSDEAVPQEAPARRRGRRAGSRAGSRSSASSSCSARPWRRSASTRSASPAATRSRPS